MSSAPIMRIPMTTVTAVRDGYDAVYKLRLCSVARAKVSSKVTANMRGYSRTNIKSTTAESTMLSTASAWLSERMLPNM